MRILKLYFAEEADFEESYFNEEWLDDDNWYIIDDENRKKGIYTCSLSR